MMSPIYIFIVFAIFVFIVDQTQAVEWSKFKTCSELGFCRRHRQFSAPPDSQYTLSSQSFKVSTWNGHSAFTGVLKAFDRPDILLVVITLSNGMYRVVFDDVDKPQHRRHIVPDVIMSHVEVIKMQHPYMTLSNSVIQIHPPNVKSFLKISCNPFRIEHIPFGSLSPRIVLNADNRLLMDQFTPKPTPPSNPPQSEHHQSSNEQSNDQNNNEQQSVKTETQDDSSSDPTEPSADSEKQCDGCWSESVKGHTDPKLRGPESIGLDLSFPSATHIYGLPERTVKFALEDTIDKDGNVLSEPSRFYNLDVFEFELDKQLGLYGTIPFMYARNGKDFVAALWLNSAETYVDVHGSDSGKKTHWYSETGLIDVFLFNGPSPKAILEDYFWLTGRPSMPQRFALGYHQCRWNYRDEDDSRSVDASFDQHEIPYDVLWLDIEHTDGKRYFTWDTERFPDATRLQNHLASRGRKMVTIVDPHVKRDGKYNVHRMGTDENMYVKKPDGSDYDGWCWPGSSSYFDYTSERVRKAFGSLFCSEKYPHFSENLHIWNDMNEPSVFNGPEGTMAKDLIHENDTEHRHVHNIYGHYFMQATFEGVRKGHGGNNRPFVLSRSFFVGSQRFGAIWTGDNTADWEHMKSSVRMLLPLQICGMVFSGADVGGFFGNPNPELLSRWYQVGAFQPFFRGHAHLDTNRREPWLFGEPYTTVIRAAIRARYEMIAYWYTLFAGNVLGEEHGFETSSNGPPMRPMWWEFDEDKESMTNENQWMIGNALLAAPVMEEGAKTHKVYIPEGEMWYDLYAPGENGKKLKSKGGELEMTVNLDRIVVFQRGGTIIPRQLRQRRSTVAMAKDPLTLVVALDKNRAAVGELYLDDGKSYNFENGAFVVRKFELNGSEFKVSSVGGDEKAVGENGSTIIERIVILGYGSKAPSSVTEGDRNVDFVVNEKTEVLTLQRVNVPAGRGEWSIHINP